MESNIYDDTSTTSHNDHTENNNTEAIVKDNVDIEIESTSENKIETTENTYTPVVDYVLGLTNNNNIDSLVDVVDQYDTEHHNINNNNNSDDETFLKDEILNLKQIVENKEKENANLELKLSELENTTRTTIDQLHIDFKNKLEQTFKKYEESQKDKTSMIMNYAAAEKRCIELNRNIELLQSKLNATVKEKQRVIEKLDAAQIDKQKLNESIELKVNEINHLKKNIVKLKEVNVLNEAKHNLTQNKFKLEIDAHTMTKNLYEKLKLDYENFKNSSINENKDDAENRSEMVKIEEAEEKEETVVKKEEKFVEEKDDELKRDYKQLDSKYKDLIEQMNTLKHKLVFYEQEFKTHETTISKYNETLHNQKQMNKDLLTEILQLRELQATLNKEQNEKTNLLNKIESLTNELNESNQELFVLNQKQDELLAFTQKLTEKNTSLQSNNSVLNEKLKAVEFNLNEVKNSLKQSDETIKTLSNSLNEKLSEQIEKNKFLSEELDKKTELVEELTIKLDDEKDENVTLKKKHAANIKDLSKQIQKLQKQVETTPSVSTQKCPNSNSNNNIIRSNSINSLTDAKDDMKSINGSISSTDSNHNHHPNPSQHQNQQIQESSDNYVYVVDIDKQKIIEKLVKLQRTLAKRNEKIDFLQDHANQLTLDLQKKTRIIQAYAMKEDSGVLTSNSHDAHKREIASRKTGIMSSLYSSSSNNNNNTHLSTLNGTNMTMELCLEINAKLQAVLEDTLIKNITLKENLETLGQEIAKLSQENRQIQIKMQE